MAEQEQKKKEQRKRVAIVSPIGEAGSDIRARADEIADYIVKPVAEEFGFGIFRSDREATPGPITPRILRAILDAPVTVVDVTGHNPNVFYELCFAHSFGKPVVVLKNDTSNIPFDIKDERVIAVGDQEGKIGLGQGEETKEKLREAFEAVLQEDFQPTSIVNEVANVQNIESLTPKDPIASELANVRRRVDQIYGLLPRIAAQQRVTSEGYKLADLKALMELTESLIGQGVVTTGDLEPLVTDITSPTFDEWIDNKVQAMRDDDSDGENFDEIPF